LVVEVDPDLIKGQDRDPAGPGLEPAGIIFPRIIKPPADGAPQA
jgi:hypothetical protein